MRQGCRASFEVKKTKNKKKSHQTLIKHTTKYIHSSPTTATTSRRRAVKHVLLGSPYSHSSSIDLGFVEIGLACIHTYVYTRTAATAAPFVYVWCSVLFSGQRSFVFLCRDTRMYRRFRGCPVVLDIELSVSAWYQKTRRALYCCAGGVFCCCCFWQQTAEIGGVRCAA